MRTTLLSVCLLAIGVTLALYFVTMLIQIRLDFGRSTMIPPSGARDLGPSRRLKTREAGYSIRKY